MNTRFKVFASYNILQYLCDFIHVLIFVKGASTVKWTALDPCSGLSESDPKLHTNFEFHEIEIHRHLENI
jgi:hypothetical protein